MLIAAYLGLIRYKAKHPDLPLDDPSKAIVKVPDFFDTARTGLHFLLPVIVLISLMVATGLTMSPGFDTVCPWLLDLFGGRQSARSIHFISASLIVLFVAIHLIEVVLAGPINEVRSILTGRYVVPKEHRE